MKKQLCAFLAVFVAVVLTALCFASAGTTRPLRIQNVEILADNALKISFYSTINPTTSNLSVSIDGNELSIASISGYTEASAPSDQTNASDTELSPAATFMPFIPTPTLLYPQPTSGDPEATVSPNGSAASSAAQGTSWLFVVDTATVSTNQGAEPIRNLLTELIELVAPGDNAYVTSAVSFTSNEYSEGLPLLEDAEKLRKMSQQLYSTSAEISFSDAINNALNLLENAADVRQRKCVVIVSHGTDINTDASVIQTVKNSSATVYSIALDATRTEIKEYDLNGYFSIAESSVGGMGILQDLPSSPSQGKRDAAVQAIISAISENEQRFYIVVTKGALLSVNSLLSLTLTSDGDGYLITYTDSYRFTGVPGNSGAPSYSVPPIGFVPAPTPTPVLGPTSTPSSNPSATPTSTLILRTPAPSLNTPAPR